MLGVDVGEWSSLWLLCSRKSPWLRGAFRGVPMFPGEADSARALFPALSLNTKSEGDQRDQREPERSRLTSTKLSAKLLFSDHVTFGLCYTFPPTPSTIQANTCIKTPPRYCPTYISYMATMLPTFNIHSLDELYSSLVKLGGWVA